MKNYSLQISIIIAAIIISIAIYMSVTAHDRKAYNHCLKLVYEKDEERKKKKCESFVYDR
jgi:hypothetical protein